MPVAIALTWYLNREKKELEKKADDSDSAKKSTGVITAIRKKAWDFWMTILVL